MKKGSELPAGPATTSFRDLEGMIAWHREFAECFRRKANRISHTAAVTENCRHKAMLATYLGKVQMHESAVRVLEEAVAASRRRAA